MKLSAPGDGRVDARSPGSFGCMRRGSCLVANWLEGIVLDCTNDLFLVMQPVTRGFEVDGCGSLKRFGYLWMSGRL